MTDDGPIKKGEPLGDDDVSRQAISQVVARLCVGRCYNDERREHARYPVAVPVIVTPLSDDRAPAGEPVTMMTMNLSLGGAALIYKDAFEAPLAALSFLPAGVACAPIVLRVLRHSRIGAMHVIAGEFAAAGSALD